MEKAGEMLGAARDGVTGAFQTTKDKTVETTKAVSGGSNAPKDNAGDYINTAMKTVTDSAVSVGNTAQAGFQATTEKVVEVSGGAADAVKNALGMGGNPVTKKL